MEEDDLERAGTLSRRQLTNPKPISIYPPAMSSFPLNKIRRSGRNVNTKLLFLLCTCCLFLFYYHIKPIQPQTQISTEVTEPLQYSDTTQWTDYKYLNKLIAEKDKDSGFSNRVKHSQKSIARQLSEEPNEGHTFDELRRLTNNIELPIISFGSTRRVPVTAIIHTKTVSQVYMQVQAVLTQTALPEYIWVICDTLSKANVEARIMTLDRRRVRVIARDNNQQSHHWLQSAAYAATDFIWIVDQDIAPGKRYLENILKLSLTPQYKDTLLGTEAAVFTQQLECIPDAMHSGSRQMKSQLVDVINDSWVLRRSWISVLMNAIMKEDKEDMPIELTGLFISKTLYMNAGIPSVAIPTDPIERAYWGDVRLKRTKKFQTCKEIEKWMDTPNTLHYRDTVSADSLLFLVDSPAELDSLSPLVCAFSAHDDVSVHMVTSGKMRGISDQEVKIKLPELCNSTAVNVIIHDLHILYDREYKHSNIATEVLHDLIHIISLMEPQVIIHSMDTQRDLYKSIETIKEVFRMPIIGMPSEDVSHALWMADLPLEVLSKWNDFSIQLFINIGKTPQPFTRLIQSASDAHYLGDQVDMTLLIDPSSDQLTQVYASEYRWNKGRKHLRYRINPAHRTLLFAESWYPSHNNEYAIILDHDVELSKYYYTWAKYLILRYRYMETVDEVFGISLYSPQITETDPKGRKIFNPIKQMEDRDLEASQIYAMQSVTPTGGLFFPEHWREFHDYITARLADRNGYQIQHRGLSELKSSKWHNSWRKYFEELIYLRSYVMLYPNFDDHISLSTRHVELKKKGLRDRFQDAISVYNVPLMTEDIISTELDLPDFGDIPVFDIWGKLSSYEILRERSFQTHEEVSACVPHHQYENKYDPVDLLCPFAAIISVPVKNGHEHVPVLPMKDVTLYLEPLHPPIPEPVTSVIDELPMMDIV